MAEVQRPAWLTELIEVARQLQEFSGGATEGREDGRPKRLGRANRDLESEPGWFWVDPGSRAAESDQLEAAFLAAAEGSAQRRFQAMETVQDGNVLRVKVASFAPFDGLFLWVPRRGSARLEGALLDGLAQISRFDLVNRFGQGRADPVPVAQPSGRLNADQARGLAACLAPGVQLIWGPPGTGKTELISAALQDLIARGKSVLLVSGTDVAVDDALGRAARDLDPDPGVMVRVGTPHLADVAADPRICMQRMILDRLDQLDRDRINVEAQIATLRSHPDLVRLDNAQAELAGFDPDAYHEARQRIDNDDRLAGLGTQMARIREQAAASLVALAAAQAEYDQARRSWEETALSRQHLKAATELELELGNIARESDRAIADVTRLQAERDRLKGESDTRPGGITGLSRRRELKRLHDQAAEVDRRLAAADARMREAERTLASFSRQAAERIEGHLRAAEPITDDAVARRRITLSAAEKQLRHAWDVQQECISQAQEVDGQITQAEHRQQPTAADLEMVALADRRDLIRKLAGLPELESQASDVLGEIDRLERRAGQLVSQLVQEGRAVRREIVDEARVVATTLDMLRVRPELRERHYDHVLVDEAAAARLPDIVYAVSRATEGATLLGDFLQNGPAVGAEFERSRDLAIQRWLWQDCFALFGIHSTGSAQANPACVTLTQQYRFGPAVNDLANAVAYGGLLHAADRNTADRNTADRNTADRNTADRNTADVTDQEIVLVDVDGLGDELTAVRQNPGGSGKWWPIGALVSAALADRHSRSSDTPVAVITPYYCQQELIRGQLGGSAAPPRIEVGTADRFQGREFDTVIFDLVENGQGRVAKGRPGPERHRLDGLRLFNVGITRAQRRLYVIANEALVRGSGAGPLHALRTLLEQGRVRVVRVAGLLELTSEPAGDPVASDVWNALRALPAPIGLYDENYLPDELRSRIDQARERIWLWGPWVGQQSRELVPHLVAAAERGVRVHVIVLPRADVNQRVQPRHHELSRELPNAVFLHKEHHKIIVVDRKLIFIGSTNLLGESPREQHGVMSLLEGADLVERILRQERADVLARPPACPRCGSPVREAVERGSNGNRRLHWLCRGRLDHHDCGWSGPFPDLPGARNQARPQDRSPGH